MCTLIFALRAFESTPLVVATNRDEALDRPSSPPSALQVDPTIIGPRDDLAGGTWIGANETGLFAGITNRDVDIEGERSRGLLVLDVLEEPDLAGAEELVTSELERRAYAGFNLVIADDRDAVLIEWDGTANWHRFSPGVHVVVNAGREGRSEKATAIADHLQVKPGEPVDHWLDRAATILENHELDVCVHRDGYGTRSSSLLTIDADHRLTYRFAEGPSCQSSSRTFYGE